MEEIIDIKATEDDLPRMGWIHRIRKSTRLGESFAGVVSSSVYNVFDDASKKQLKNAYRRFMLRELRRMYTASAHDAFLYDLGVYTRDQAQAIINTVAKCFGVTHQVAQIYPVVNNEDAIGVKIGFRKNAGYRALCLAQSVCHQIIDVMHHPSTGMGGLCRIDPATAKYIADHFGEPPIDILNSIMRPIEIPMCHVEFEKADDGAISVAWKIKTPMEELAKLTNLLNMSEIFHSDDDE